MKSFNVIHIVLFILMLLVYQCTQAQDYVLTVKGDTLKGEIKALSYGTDKKVQVSDAERKKTVFPIFQVKEYRVKNEIFHPVKGSNGYTFMKRIKSGYLSLYGFQLENQTSYDGLFLLKKDGRGIDVPNLGFKKALKNFLSDCDEVVTKIDDGTYSKNSLTLIIDDYNNCIDQRSGVSKPVSTTPSEQTEKAKPWESLESKIKAKEFEGKADALEMVAEIKSKISKGEKIPKFLIEGLKNSLKEAGLLPEAEEIIKD